MNRASSAALIGFVAAMCAALAGCAPKIGSKCVLNSDCGTNGTLVCDTSQPGGYCTEFNCTPNACQSGAACVVFLPQVPGCPYDDYRSPSRTARAFCLEHCSHDSDCRDGYVCMDPRQPPWSAAITDDNQSKLVCIVAPDMPIRANESLPDGSVCSPSGPAVPPIDAGPEPADAVTEAGLDGAAVEGGEGGDGGADAAIDGGPDAGVDGEVDAGVDAGVTAGVDGALGDGAADGAGADGGAADSPIDGPVDSGAPDASGSG